jgi:ribonuclease D
MDRRFNPWLKSLKQFVNEKADALNIPAPMLAQARTLESLVVATASGSTELPEELQGWRESVIGIHLMGELRRISGAHASRASDGF